MPERLFRLYQRKRIINVNFNVVAAGVLAIALGKLPVHHVSLWIGPERRLVNSLAAGVIDMVLDVAIYFGLHWVANHWSPFKPRTAKDELHQRAKRPPFWKDATLVQFERAILSPLYYVVAIGLMYSMQEWGGLRASWAFVWGFLSGIVVTRVVHTTWGLRTGTFTDHAKREGNSTEGEVVGDEARPPAA